MANAPSGSDTMSLAGADAVCITSILAVARVRAGHPPGVRARRGPTRTGEPVVVVGVGGGGAERDGARGPRRRRAPSRDDGMSAGSSGRAVRAAIAPAHAPS